MSTAYVEIGHCLQYHTKRIIGIHNIMEQNLVPLKFLYHGSWCRITVAIVFKVQQVALTCVWHALPSPLRGTTTAPAIIVIIRPCHTRLLLLLSRRRCCSRTTQ